MHPNLTLQWCISCLMIGLYCLMKHATLSIFQTQQLILYVMIASLSMMFFYFLTTSQLFYITFLAFRKFLQNFVFPLNSVNETSSRIELDISVMIWLQTETIQLPPNYLCLKTSLSYPTVALFCYLLTSVVFTTCIASGSKRILNPSGGYNTNTTVKISLLWDGYHL